MLVHFVTDDPTKIPAIRAMLEPRYHIAPQVLGSGDTQIDSSGVIMVDADLRKIHRVEQIQLVLQELSCIREKLFVVHNQVRSMVAQAYALGATAVVSRPKEIIFKLAQIEIAEKSAQSDIAIASPEITESTAAFASMFSAVRVSKQINCQMPSVPRYKSSIASRKKGLLPGLTTYAAITKEPSSIVAGHGSGSRLCVGNRVL